MATSIKYGKLTPDPHPARLKLSKYLLSAALPPWPAKRRWQDAVTRWLILGNDVFGLCTCSAILHIIQLICANAGKAFARTREMAIALYKLANPSFNPETGANDNGAQETDVLSIATSEGIAGHKVRAYVDVDFHNPTEILNSINLFGAVYCGTAMTRPMEQQFAARQAWTLPYWWWNRTIGLHAVPLVGYSDPDFGPDVLPWGLADNEPDNTPSPVIPVAWNLMQTNFDEAHVLLMDDWFTTSADGTISPTAKAPNGLDYATLCSDLQALTTA